MLNDGVSVCCRARQVHRMSSPTQQPPFAPMYPSYGQEPVPAQAPQPSPPPYWPPPPVARQNNALAITAVVLASLALLIGLGSVVPLFVAAMFFGGASASGGFTPMDLEGTAPQVVQGRAYPGSLLEHEVARVVEYDGSTVSSVSCPATPAVVAHTVTLCHGVVDDADSQLKVTFEDDLGHFTLVES